MIYIIAFFFLFLAMGIPVSFTFGFSALLYLFITGRDLIIITQRMFAGTDSFTLMAIPLFMFAGEIMGACGITPRIARFANALIGFVPSGLAQVNVMNSAILTGFNGSTLADIASLGKIQVDMMSKAGYDRNYAAALSAASSTIGSIHPPSILMVLYASLSGISVGRLFMSGIIPSLITTVSQMAYAFIMAKIKPKKYDGVNTKFDKRELLSSFISVSPALLIPVIILGGILTGIFTATEAGAVACVWGLIVGTFIYREFNLQKIVQTMINGIKTSGMVMIIVAGAMLFSWCLAVERFPVMVADLIFKISTTPSIVMCLIVIAMLVIGFFMDATPAAIIMVPIFQPIAAAMGFDPIHFGMVMVLTLVMAGITPPCGIVLFVTCAVGKVTFSELMVEMWPFIIISTGILFLIAYVPITALFLPNLLFG